MLSVGGGYFTTDTRHILYGDDGSETRLSITVHRPLANTTSIIRLWGYNRGEKKGFFPTGDYIKNVWIDVRVWQTY